MRFALSTIAAVGTLSSLVAADNIYTYTKPGCSGCAFFFKDIDHNICAVSITANATDIADAIAKGVTTVQSGKLEVQECGEKRFIAWDEGPESNDDGLLQCGNIDQKLRITETSTCITGGNFHGFSWTEPGSDGSDSNSKRQTDDADDVWKCTGSTEPYGVYLGGKHYQVKGIDQADADALMDMAWNDNTDVPSDFEKYAFTPGM
ncbi:uncharacterized protein J4E84_008320 [Alternaria hordeiaustralica]|uniref:uncharacterized protein n=1 Tax=Alternaria hordeiaustralica TaxID=1187925 RepID=UPI0020C3C072|nr:uncharacterized protein J4E84_008320 [Alternaria hordeiaustralica]KAI4679292.1 hypothetical protein J4E84_008320 [Alternaria hordeiaustralica]